MFKFWFKLLQTENCILRAAYGWSYCICENEKQNYQSWAKFIKDQLYNLGLGYMWNGQNNLNSRICLPIIQKRLKDNFIQTLHGKMQIETKCFIYKHLVDNFCFNII